MHAVVLNVACVVNDDDAFAFSVIEALCKDRKRVEWAFVVEHQHEPDANGVRAYEVIYSYKLFDIISRVVVTSWQQTFNNNSYLVIYILNQGHFSYISCPEKGRFCIYQADAHAWSSTAKPLLVLMP